LKKRFAQKNVFLDPTLGNPAAASATMLLLLLLLILLLLLLLLLPRSFSSIIEDFCREVSSLVCALL
jgi:hypothetical protein